MPQPSTLPFEMCCSLNIKTLLVIICQSVANILLLSIYLPESIYYILYFSVLICYENLPTSHWLTVRFKLYLLWGLEQYFCSQYWMYRLSHPLGSLYLLHKGTTLIILDLIHILIYSQVFFYLIHRLFYSQGLFSLIHIISYAEGFSYLRHISAYFKL